jgi:hypothetical protein
MELVRSMNNHTHKHRHTLVLAHNNHINVLAPRTVIAHQSTHSGSVFSLNGIPAAASDRGFVLINHFGTIIITNLNRLPHSLRITSHSPNGAGNVVMEVEAGHDVVLFVALVVCVEKMHAKQMASAAASRRH